ncbi:MAG: AI-2E family transporter [Verrucomicrobia bacterium]|nr:AI-2E family transporter [Verrucomicrobiota bacterium]MCF7708327.1 AI-2E family transporter [Verrucomicrobiota bacterium]
MTLPKPTEKQAKILWTSLTALAIGVLISLFIIAIIGAGLVINKLTSVLLPLAIAGIIAYLLDPVIDFLERRRIPRERAILLVFAIGAALFLMFLSIIVPRLIVQTGDLINRLPDYSQKLQKRILQWSENPPFGVTLPIDFGETSRQNNIQNDNTNGIAVTNTEPTNTPPVTTAASDTPETEQVSPWQIRIGETALSWLGNVLPRIGNWFVSQLSMIASWLGLLVGLALVPIYAFYFLLEKRGIVKHWTQYLPVRESSFKEEIVFILTAVNNYLILFFRGQVLVAICDGILLTIGFMIIGLKYSLLLGVVAGFLSIVPYLGVMLSIIPTTALAAAQFGDWVHPVLVLVVFAVVQTLEGLVISPKIMGDRVGLHPMTIIVAVMVGTTLLGGVLGGVLAIPLTAALRVIMFRYVWKKD